VATVMGVNPKRDIILKLSNNECIPDDTMVRRIHSLEKIEGRLALIEHPGIFRRISNFNLKKLNMPAGYNVGTEGDRVGNIVRKNLSKFKKKVKKSGFAPMDMMHRWGKAKHSDSDGGGDSDSDGGGDSDSDGGGDIEIEGKRNEHNESDSDGDSSGPLIRDHSPMWKKQRQQKEKTSRELTGASSLLDSSLESSSVGSDTSITRVRKEDFTKRLLSLRDTPESEESDANEKDIQIIKASTTRSDKKACFVDSDIDSDDSKITESRIAFQEKENELALLGLSDDEIPQAVFSTGKKQRQPKKDFLEKSPRLWKNRVEKNKQQQQQMKEQYDSSFSMSFHSSSVEEQTKLPKQDILALDDSSSTDSDTKRTRKLRDALDVSSSDSDSFDRAGNRGAGIVRKKFKKGLRPPTHVGVNRNEHSSKKSLSSKKQSSSQMKIGIQKSCLSISFRKYN